MAVHFKRHSTKPGLPPGELVHIGEHSTEKVKISIIDYNQDHWEEKKVDSIEECFAYKDTPTVTWIDIEGIHDAAVMEKVGEYFGLHPLILEDIMNSEQRPKMDDLDDVVFIVAKMLYYDENQTEITIEQISFVLGQNFVLSFQERSKDVFAPVRERIRKAKGRIRSMGPDYLVYALLDGIVDHYFVVLEAFGDRIESMEDELLSQPSSDTLETIHKMKKELISLRKSVWPLREVIGSLERGEPQLIREKTQVFIRDLYDHTIQVMETVETYRDMMAGLQDLYLSSVSNKMNEVMKILTIVATIFIPLTFIAGVYGMNFSFIAGAEMALGVPHYMGCDGINYLHYDILYEKTEMVIIRGLRMPLFYNEGPFDGTEQ